MKNNKNFTYALLIVVSGLWILVFIRIYQSFFSDEKIVEATAFSPVKVIQEDAKDTFDLMANYRDPFLGKPTSPIESPSAKVLKAKVVRSPEVTIDWSFINYMGLIKNQKSQRGVAMVTIHGKEFMVSEGEKVEEVSFLKNLKDSIEISYLGKRTYIRKK